MKIMKIITPLPVKSKKETKKKSKNNLFVPKRKNKNDSQLKEAVSNFNSVLMDDNSTKKLIAYMRKENKFTRKYERNVPQGSSTPASTSFSQSRLQRNQYTN